MVNRLAFERGVWARVRWAKAGRANAKIPPGRIPATGSRTEAEKWRRRLILSVE